MPIKLAIFDMAGTTVADNNNVAKAFQKSFSDNGIAITLEDANPLMGYHKPAAIRMLLDKLNIACDDGFVEKVHAGFQVEMLDFYEYDAGVRPVKDAEYVFEQLKQQGIRIALNTGFSKSIADTIVQRFQWKEKGLIDDLIGSDEVEKGRPYPFMIEELMQRAGISDPSEVAKIGDTTVDIEEGRNAGCSCVVAITSGAGQADELEKMKPTHIVHNLSEIPFLLKQ